MSFPKFINADDIEEITNKIGIRQGNLDEDLMVSIGVVLMNYGDKYVEVTCVMQEWRGTKGMFPPHVSIPVCPNGHSLLEITRAPRLALVNER